ncbi:uncharacterized protein [Palaemon carinicauda]|uniref:uncharacterized protein n=1 Tax=Palaemon carinicauda TaxID=392227 RepID=UPI0035B5E6AD
MTSEEGDPRQCGVFVMVFNLTFRNKRQVDMEAFREVNLSDGKCNVSLYVCADEEKKIDADPEYASELFKAAIEGKLPSACDESETDGSDSETEGMAKKEKNNRSKDVEWDSEATDIFVDVLKRNVKWLPLNKAGTRRQLFQKIKRDMEAEGYSASMENIREKFNSLVHTYRRIKFKTKEDGIVNTKWQYFEDFDGIMKSPESSKLKFKGVSEYDSKDKGVVEVKLEPNVIDNDKALVAVPSELFLSPSQIQSGSSNSMSNEASPEDPKKQRPTKENRSKASFANSATKKRKRNQLNPPESASLSSNSNNATKGIEHIVVGSEGFNHAATLLFIDCIKKHEDMLKMKKSSEMFFLIKKEMACEGFLFTETKLRKKWYNLLISYRRILERANETGDLISSWPYYEAIDNIIVNTKVLAQTKREEVHRFGDYSEASTSKAFRDHSSDYQSMKKGEETGNENEVEENGVLGISKESDISERNLKHEFLNVVNRSYIEKHDNDDRDFQRNFLEEWEKREIRREERDNIKLEVLKEIAKSLSVMTSKQDELLELLKNLK